MFKPLWLTIMTALLSGAFGVYVAKEPISSWQRYAADEVEAKSKLQREHEMLTKAMVARSLYETDAGKEEIIRRDQHLRKPGEIPLNP